MTVEDRPICYARSTDSDSVMNVQSQIYGLITTAAYLLLHSPQHLRTRGHDPAEQSYICNVMRAGHFKSCVYPVACCLSRRQQTTCLKPKVCNTIQPTNFRIDLDHYLPLLCVAFVFFWCYVIEGIFVQNCVLTDTFVATLRSKWKQWTWSLIYRCSNRIVMHMRQLSVLSVPIAQ